MGLLERRKARRDYKADPFGMNETETIETVAVDDTAVVDLPDNTGWTTELLAELGYSADEENCALQPYIDAAKASEKPWESDEPWPDEDDGDSAWPRTEPEVPYDVEQEPSDPDYLPPGAVQNKQDVYEGGSRCAKCGVPTPLDGLCVSCLCPPTRR